MLEVGIGAMEGDGMGMGMRESGIVLRAYEMGEEQQKRMEKSIVAAVRMPMKERQVVGIRIFEEHSCFLLQMK